MKNISRNGFARAAISGLALAAAALAGSPAEATNGYFQHGYGAGAKAMAGVGTALPQDTASVMHNPAGIVYLGNRIDIGIGAFMPDRKITATGGGTISDGVYRSSERLFLIPDMGVSHKIDPDSSISLTMNANGGMNTEYKTNPFTNFGGSPSTPAGVDLAQAFVGLTYARKFGNHAFGITPTFAAQKFKAYGLQAFTGVSVDSAAVTDNGYEWSYGGGFRIGYLGKFMDDTLSVGASYQSKMQMSKLKRYQGLFANRGEFDIPAALALGVAYKVDPKLTIGADYQWIMYRDVDSVGNDGVMSLTSLGGAGEKRLGGTDHAPGFGWNDVHVFKIGAMYQMNDALTLRAGASYNTETYTDHDMLFNILAPGVIRAHLSVGATYEVKPGHAINFAYTHALSASESGTHVSNGSGTLEHTMDQNEIFVGYNYRW